MSAQEALPSSFRDPAGRMVRRGGVLYREVSHAYGPDYEALMGSGLYQELVGAGLLVSHAEVAAPPELYKVLQPELVPFISYPYEWSFSQLKDAALATLAIQKLAMARGLSLKDASAYNVQFVGGRPVLIDTLSFERLPEERPWVAYAQFCRHFLAPLALMSRADLRLGLISRDFIDGIPLDLASRLLPARTWLSLGLAAHLHLHAGSQTRHSGKPSRAGQFKMPKNQVLALLENLERAVGSLKFPRQATVWGDYYANTNYVEKAEAHKKRLVGGWIAKIAPATLWDAGSNDATFASLASSQGIRTLASDIDPVAVERAYRRGDANLLPLVVDLTNPSPAIGWRNRERDSFLSRVSVDLSMALALVHHLAIANNLPLGHIADMFADAARALIIEFVPKEDSNTQKLLAAREDIFPDYTEAGFEKAFSQRFRIMKKEPLEGSLRTLYLLERR